MAEVKQLYKDAFAAFARGDLDAAVEGYRRAVETDPGFALAWQGLAEVYGRQDRLDEAIEAIGKAIEADPAESLYHTGLSRFLQRQGKIPEAEAAAMEAQRVQSRGPA
ncbi:MAG: tetratricopeptide repeat protein [Deltaproteobacteria bacterium]|jgi:tetratricopeptide (TPR) repeat protein|nr:tetratricopeptide repeat protein [Deltaproteobacteria bacterium]MBW2412895.1 tetratricopeptide repeat protein [Deltaproteobacteria bacterium]